MPYLTTAVWLLMTLLSFPSVAYSKDVDPTDDFCSLSAHMSRTLSNLLKCFHAVFTNQRLENIVAQKDGILYIAGGLMLYPSPDLGHNGPSSYPIRTHSLLPSLQANDWTTRLDTVLRSLNVSKRFQTSLDSVDYIRTEEEIGRAHV